MNVNGFDTDAYLKAQTGEILDRVDGFERLYLEFGGKLCYDMHAARVLPGYRETAKIELLKQLGDIDLIYCVSAKDLARGRVRRDFGLTYDNQTLKDLRDIADFGLEVDSVVISRFDGQEQAEIFRNKLENFGFNVYLHSEIPGYPYDIESVLRGYERQPYVETAEKLVIVTGVGGNSGKMAFCMSQIHHDRGRGENTGFAKFETFPIWNLDISHPINMAYEAATADLGDVNVVDRFHEDAYGVSAVNYNRDMENFNILRNLMRGITGDDSPFGYMSPTDMGVNMAGDGIVDDGVCRRAAEQEIIRRYFRYRREKVEGIESQETVDRMMDIMEKAGVGPEDRRVVGAARKAASEAEGGGKGFKGVFCGAAIELGGGRMVTGKNSNLLHSESAAILNAVKELGGVPDGTDLIGGDVLKRIAHMKKELLNKRTPCLNVEETLIAMAVSSASNPVAKKALSRLKELRGCEMHITHLPTPGDEAGLIRLKMNVTTDAKLSQLSGYGG